MNVRSVILALAVLGMAGCSVSVGTSTSEVPADKVATTAEDALEKSIGQRPIIDCGTDDFKFVDGETRDCVLTTDPPGTDKYQAVVTLEDVDASAGTFTVNVEVGDEPLP